MSLKPLIQLTYFFVLGSETESDVDDLEQPATFGPSAQVGIAAVACLENTLISRIES